MALCDNTYGKTLVRLTRVTKKADGTHLLKELNVQVLLRGEYFAAAYDRGDNSPVIPTDTIKNTVYIIAKKDPVEHAETYAVALAKHFIDMYPKLVSQATITIEESLWARMQIRGSPHPHSFVRSSPELHTVKVSLKRGADGAKIVSGVKNLLVLKTTGSGFVGFHKDQYTTLPEVKDRIFSTIVECRWRYNAEKTKLSNYRVLDYTAVWNGVKDAFMTVFAENYSVSVQATLYEAGREALARYDEIESIKFTLPNKHNWLVDLARFGLENNNEIFTPTSEPSGLIKGTVSRVKKAKL